VKEMENYSKLQRTLHFSSMETNFYVEDLPCEILVLILSFLDGTSLISCGGVCVSWNRLVAIQDHLFKDHCQQKVGEEIVSLLEPASWKSFFISLINDKFLNLILEAIDTLGEQLYAVVHELIKL
jgi:hypothetical protein